MKTKKTLISLLIICVFFLSLGASAFAVAEQSDSFYVADYANVLSSKTEQMIINYNGALEKQCDGAQIVVVTVEYLDGMYSDEYAYQLFNNWGVGSDTYDNGMLLLLATEEKKGGIAYGLGLTSELSESDINRMLDKYFWDDVDNGDYDEAVNSIFPVLLKWYDDKYDSAVASAAKGAAERSYSSQGHSGSSFGFGSLVRIIVFILIIRALFGGGRRGYRRSGGSVLPWLFLFNSMNRSGGGRDHRDDRRGGGGFGGGGFGGGFGGGGFGGGSGHGGGGLGGGFGGRR